jgi:hypothetical protein
MFNIKQAYIKSMRAFIFEFHGPGANRSTVGGEFGNLSLMLLRLLESRKVS